VSIKRWLGMDLFDLIIQAGVTVCLMAWVGMADGPPELFPMILGASFAVWGVRRHFALRKLAAGETTGEVQAQRIQELEERVHDVETLQDRVLELEERLDFTERLLARQKEPGQLPG